MPTWISKLHVRTSVTCLAFFPCGPYLPVPYVGTSVEFFQLIPARDGLLANRARLIRELATLGFTLQTSLPALGRLRGENIPEGTDQRFFLDMEEQELPSFGLLPLLLPTLVPCLRLDTKTTYLKVLRILHSPPAPTSMTTSALRCRRSQHHT